MRGNRLWTVLGIALLAGLVATYLLMPERGVPDDAPSLDEMAREIGAPIMQNLQHGHIPGRSGEVMLVPKPHSYIIGEWDLTTLTSGTPTLTNSHPNPWDYIAQVPLILYGPPYVAEGEQVRRKVDIADIAPTYAALLGMDALDADGKVLTEAVADSPSKAPKLIFTVILDGGGWNALQEHPDSWPTIQRLREGGTDYLNADIGSAPSITGALHATMGTGVYPTTHGIPGNQMRGADGKNTDTWLENADPRYLEVPTVSELWDEQNDNQPVVGTVSYEGWHLGMIGHGAYRDGGDKDIAVLWQQEEERWYVNEDYYELPAYLRPDTEPTLRAYEDALDERDAIPDGLWFGHDLEEIRDPVVRPGSPAFVQLTGDAVVDVIKKEGLGRDATTDLFWVEMKMPDFAGHRWTMDGPEEADVLRETDTQLARFKAQLDRSVGRGNYVMVISADHGQQPLPDIYAGWRINSQELLADIETRFGDILEKVTTTDLFVDLGAVESEEVDLEDVARYLGTYTIGDNIPDDATGAESVPEARLDDTIFAGAFPTEFFQSVTPTDMQSYGPGTYPESRLDRFAPAPSAGDE